MSQEVVKNPEHEKLIEILKFTPCTYTIRLWGYGGEYVMGTVERKIYDYFKHRRLDLMDYAWDSDYAKDNNIPEEMQPFPPGSWYECDDIVHESGVDLGSGTLQIDDENDNTVFEISLSEIDGCGDGSPEIGGGEEYWVDMKEPGTVVFLGTSSEKGTFFEGKIDLTSPFNSEKLCIYYDDVDGNEVVTKIEYDGEEIENYGGDTTGKSSDFGFYISGSNKQDGKGYEKYRNMDDIEYEMTPWFPAKTKPVRNGLYNIKTKDGYSYQGKWTGERWISSWQEDNEGSETIKVKEWQGLANNPDLEESING